MVPKMAQTLTTLHPLTGSPAGDGSDGGVEDCKIENIQIRHKYAGPIPCSITISYGGVGQHHLFILSITRARQSQLPMIVTDPKGKVGMRGWACVTIRSCLPAFFLPFSHPSFLPALQPCFLPFLLSFLLSLFLLAKRPS